MEINYKQKLKDLKDFLIKDRGLEKAQKKLEKLNNMDQIPANTYDPMIAASPNVSKKRQKEILDFTNKQIVAGIKAPFQAMKARAQTRKNIKSMANTAAMAELRNTSNLPASERGTNKAFNRASQAYKQTKKELKKQIPRKYR